ncbi:hypothetical protein Misp01_10510 [Microtetraspora sp. NBRC 13810]|uniref:ATP-binding SpoIIE family protein phosphatase n=1 Tax=Microtetraspora sp. NBRC 13810 TaxID=3030990 RepID=UPI0024A5A7C3|nr:ATP-binding SpoIIE family protein phosphatase [Microtetraspora sp. NBRC 13810]GLW05921.1 hypothetical protein Misp01_10510 [Microtetraspora sp. NBRC 13810]
MPRDKVEDADFPPARRSPSSLHCRLPLPGGAAMAGAALETRITRVLQEGLTPPAPPALNGVEVGYRHLPAVGAPDGGRPHGDWLDALPLPGGRTALAVGDVMGDGWRSAAVLARLRTAMRALCGLHPDPARLLGRLDDLAGRLCDGHPATFLYVTYDPATRRCRLANAGHLPPILVTPGGAGRVLDAPPGPPIGAGGARFRTVEFDVPDGSHLILSTDGLAGTGQGLAGLLERVSGPPRPLDQLCEDAIRPLGRAAGRGDVALLVARLGGPRRDDVAETALASSLCVISQARAFARAALTRWRLDAVAPTVELLVSELVTNAIRHARRPIGLRLARDGGLLCEVSDGDATMPELRQPDPTAENGRGLHLVAAFSARWGACRTRSGKIVWFGHPGREERD